MDRLANVTAGRRSKWIVVVAWLAAFAALGPLAGQFEGKQENDQVSFLPGEAESVKALQAVKELPGGERAAAVVVYKRASGLTARDRASIQRDRARFNADVPPATRPLSPPQYSGDGTAALLVTSISGSGDAEEALNDATQRLRDETTPTGGGLEVAVTGPAGFSLDASKAFEGINGTLLIATASLVFVLLLVIYRSPIFWLFPLLALGFAEVSARGFGTLLADAGVTINGQSGGILPVLVFGAGTDYALLLVARYREELRRHEDRHQAMRVAMRRAGPAIFASGMTVIAGLLCLSLAEVNGTAGLGPIGAMGIALAMVTSLTLLPAFVLAGGRRAFWPFIPHVGDQRADETHGVWRRVGDRVARRPRRVWAGSLAVIAVCMLGLLSFNTDLTSGDFFRDEVESTRGQDLVSSAFPAGANAPTDVIVPDAERVPAVVDALRADSEVADARPVERGKPGVRIQAVLRDAPYSTAAYDQIPRLRRVVKQAGGDGVLIGGPTASEADLRKSAARDNRLIIPIVLGVIFVILALLLRALVAPLLLIATVVASYAAAFGVASFVSVHVLGFPGLEPTLPLLAFVFLVALGVDYNIFLLARVREEAQRHGTREGMLRGLAVTGGVITSAGIVLAGTFSVLAVIPLVFLTELGFAIAFGVLLDTFLVRSVLVPALAFDIGPRIWWPSALSRRADEDDEPVEGAARRRAPAAV